MSEVGPSQLGDYLSRVRRRVSVVDGVSYPAVSVLKEGAGLGVKEPFVGGITGYETLFEVRAGDVVVRTITAFESPVAVAEYRHNGSHVSQVFLTYEVSSGVLPGYLSYFFMSPTFWAEMNNRATGTVLRRKTISDAAFRGIPICVPSLPEQRRIVAVLSAVDAQTEALEREGSCMRGFYQASLRSLVDRYEPRTIESVVSRTASGGTPSREHPEYFGGEIPWVKSGEVESDAISASSEGITEAGLSNSAARWVEPGSTLVAMYGQGDTKGRAGFVVSPVTTNQAVLALTPDRAIVHDRYLLHAVRSRTESLRARAVGAAQPNLSKALVVSQEIPLPCDLETQRVEAAGLDAVLRTVQTLDAELAALRTVRTDLLAALMAQEITVDAAVDKFVKAA